MIFLKNCDHFVKQKRAGNFYIYPLSMRLYSFVSAYSRGQPTGCTCLHILFGGTLVCRNRVPGQELRIFPDRTLSGQRFLPGHPRLSWKSGRRLLILLHDHKGPFHVRIRKPEFHHPGRASSQQLHCMRSRQNLLLDLSRLIGNKASSHLHIRQAILRKGAEISHSPGNAHIKTLPIFLLY